MLIILTRATKRARRRGGVLAFPIKQGTSAVPHKRWVTIFKTRDKLRRIYAKTQNIIKK